MKHALWAAFTVGWCLGLGLYFFHGDQAKIRQRRFEAAFTHTPLHHTPIEAALTWRRTAAAGDYSLTCPSTAFAGIEEEVECLAERTPPAGSSQPIPLLCTVTGCSVRAKK